MDSISGSQDSARWRGWRSPLEQDREYAEDLFDLQQVFAAVDRRDPASLRAWFRKYAFLTGTDHARIARVTRRTIQRWRRAAGCPLPALRPLPPSARRVPTPALIAPEGWMDGTWLERQYRRFSIRQIAGAIGRSYTATRRLLRGRGIALRSAAEAARSRHPCCTQAWVLEHYVQRRLALHRCAALAGVSLATFTEWLNRFGIRIRSRGEQLQLRWRGADHNATCSCPMDTAADADE